MLFLLAFVAPLAPALDFLHIPHEYVIPYNMAVTRIKELAVCMPSAHRHTGRSGAHHSDFHGSLLVQPVMQRRVPIQESYELHFRLAQRLAWIEHSPLPSSLPEETRCAIETAVRLGGDLKDWRDHQSQQLQFIAWQLRPLSDWIMRDPRSTIDAPAPYHVWLIAGRTNVAFMAALVDGLGWRDRDLVRSFVMGAPAIGYIPDRHVYRSLGPPPSPTERSNFYRKYHDIMATNEEWNAKVARVTLAQGRNPPNAEARKIRDAVEEKTIKEQSKGLVRRVGTLADVRHLFGWGNARAMFRFGIYQKDSVRAIDNGASSGHNDATLMTETIVTPTFEYSATVARGYAAAAAAAGLPTPRMVLGLQDLSAAYRTVPCSQPQFTLFAVYSSTEDRVIFYHTPGFVFGQVSAVVAFNLFAEFMAVVPRCLFALPVDHFFDDNMIPDLAIAGNSGEDAFIRLFKAMGDPWNRHDPFPGTVRNPGLSPEKAQPVASHNRALGVLVDLSEVHTVGRVSFAPTQSRITEVLHIWRNASRDNFLPPSLAARLRGKLGFLLQASYGRVGRAATQVLVQREYHDGTSALFTAEMDHAHLFFEALLPRLPPKIVPLAIDETPPLLLYTDAMFKPKKKRSRDDEDGAGECTEERGIEFETRLGLVLYDPRDGAILYGAVVPPDNILREVLDLAAGAKTYIAQLEALAAVAAFYTFKQRLRHQRVHFFIDNTVALSAFIHGYARKVDLAKLANAFHLQLAGMHTSAYLDYVPSKANIADLPSRNEFELLIRLGGTRVPVIIPPLSSWRAPLEQWMA